jgi:tetratricopeptide (TPR) repeat protein
VLTNSNVIQIGPIVFSPCSFALREVLEVRRIEVNRGAADDRASEGPFRYDSGVSRLGSIFLLGIAACASPTLRTVPRVVDGQVEHGPFVSPYAYEWFIEGEVSAAKGRHDQAAMAFEAATAAPSDDVVLMTRLAEEFELSGASRRADRTLALARRAYPESARVVLAEGRVQRYRGMDDEALSSYARAHELEPAWDAPVIAIAETLSATGHTHRAKAILIEHIETSFGTRSEHARHVLIDLARRLGDAETLERAMALGLSSTQTERSRAAGALALRAGQPALAVRLLAPALDTPQNVVLWVRALVESGDQQEAATFLATVDSQRLGGVLDHVELLLEIGDVDVALRLLEAVEPSPRVQYLKGRALLARGDYIEAAAVLADVPIGAASFEASRMAFARCSMSQDRQGAAAEALSQAPHESLAVRRMLAEIYLEEGDLRAGLRLFDPKRPAERAALAEFFERAGRFEEAAAYYANVEVRADDAPQLRARASAEQLVSHGHPRSAIAILERWTTLAPDDLYSRVRLIELLRADDRAEAAEKRGRRTLQVIDDPVLLAHLIEVLEAPPAATQ